MQKDISLNNQDEPLNLSNRENIKFLNSVLDDLMYKKENDYKTFLLEFKNLPINIYMKIDSLRNISLDKKSDEFKEVALKAKTLSKSFHDNYK